MYELLYANNHPKGMEVIRHQNLRSLRDFIWYQKEKNIYISLSTEYILESQCDNLSTKRESGGKGDSDKSQDNPFFWDLDMFKLGMWIEKTSSWI